jgi:hypothetical protein
MSGFPLFAVRGSRALDLDALLARAGAEARPSPIDALLAKAKVLTPEGLKQGRTEADLAGLRAVFGKAGRRYLDALLAGRKTIQIQGRRYELTEVFRGSLAGKVMLADGYMAWPVAQAPAGVKVDTRWPTFDEIGRDWAGPDSAVVRSILFSPEGDEAILDPPDPVRVNAIRLAAMAEAVDGTALRTNAGAPPKDLAATVRVDGRRGTAWLAVLR